MSVMFCLVSFSSDLFIYLFILLYCIFLDFRSSNMARNSYKKITSDEDKISFVSLLLFRWMSSVFETGNERALEETDLLPLLKENTSCSVIRQLQTKWNEEVTKFKENGKRPKLWKSILKMLSVKEIMVFISFGTIYILCRILQPLLLGYLIMSLMSADTHHSYLLYACALAIGINGFVGALCLHNFGYRCELLGIRISGALKGLVYLKVSIIFRSQ